MEERPTPPRLSERCGFPTGQGACGTACNLQRGGGQVGPPERAELHRCSSATPQSRAFSGTAIGAVRG
ncbi:hypothetical protein GCM10010428_15220 [Actinosynnema pretiosum subsp. pretiosum]